MANTSPRIYSAIAAAVLIVLVSACSQRAAPPPPQPMPTTRPPPPPAPRPAVNWREAALTPGDWRWTMESGQSVARFAGGLLVLRCDRNAGTVTLLRAGAAEGDVPITISTSAMSRPLSGTPQAGPPAAIAVTLPARDPLLDAMAFSRGRFAVDISGLPTLYVPSWTEVSRVIEDCR